MPAFTGGSVRASVPLWLQSKHRVYGEAALDDLIGRKEALDFPYTAAV